MPYVIALRQTACSMKGCGLFAVIEILDSNRESRGCFCKSCGIIKWAALLREELKSGQKGQSSGDR